MMKEVEVYKGDQLCLTLPLLIYLTAMLANSSRPQTLSLVVETLCTCNGMVCWLVLVLVLVTIGLLFGGYQPAR